MTTTTTNNNEPINNVKMFIWKSGAKIIDKWHVDKLKDYPYSGAIVPVMIADKHGNIWNMGVTRCDLILKTSMVKDIKKDYDKARELLDL